MRGLSTPKGNTAQKPPTVGVFEPSVGAKRPRANFEPRLLRDRGYGPPDLELDPPTVRDFSVDLSMLEKIAIFSRSKKPIYLSSIGFRTLQYQLFEKPSYLYVFGSRTLQYQLF